MSHLFPIIPFGPPKSLAQRFLAMLLFVGVSALMLAIPFRAFHLVDGSGVHLGAWAKVPLAIRVFIVFMCLPALMGLGGLIATRETEARPEGLVMLFRWFGVVVRERAFPREAITEVERITQAHWDDPKVQIYVKGKGIVAKPRVPRGHNHSIKVHLRSGKSHLLMVFYDVAEEPAMLKEAMRTIETLYGVPMKRTLRLDDPWQARTGSEPASS